MGDSYKEVLDELERLILDTSFDSKEVQEQRIRDWLQCAPIEVFRIAYRLISISKTLNQNLTYSTGNVFNISGDYMNDSQKAGRDINASATGKGKVEAGRDINIYSKIVTKSDLDPELQESLKEAFLAIEELDEDRAVKDKALSELRGLTDELMKDKEERSEGVIAMCWRTLADFGRDVVAISRLGEILVHMGLIISTSM